VAKFIGGAREEGGRKRGMQIASASDAERSGA